MKLFPEEQTRANGKICICDFKRLDPDDFKTLYNFTKEELKDHIIIYSPDGRIFINSQDDSCELLTNIFENLMQNTQYTIEQYAKRYRQQFKDIKTFDDWGRWAATESDNEKRIHALAMLLVPVEVNRRQLEKKYYKSK